MLEFGVENSVIRLISKFRAKNDKNQYQKFLGIATLIATNIRGIPEIVDDTRGILIQNLGVDGFTASIERLIHNPKK